MKCDVCGKEYMTSELMEYPHRQIQSVTMMGFVPTGFINLVKIISPSNEPAAYWRDIVGRYNESDGWALCNSCHSEMQQFARKLIGL